MTAFDRLALASVAGLAALLRLPGLDARGRFDADQGHDMSILAAFVRDGVVPLLGPKTSVGEFHHGAFYYYLLAPSAAVSNADPVAVTAFIALLGIGAVALTWWLGRAIGGPIAGFLAGLLLATSPAAIDESTFIWNPNPIGFFAVLALAAAWRARTGGSPWWWAAALGAGGAVTQLHVLGVVFLVAILALAILDARRTRAAIPLLGGLAVVALLFVPLLVHELGTGFLETRAMLDYLAGGDPSTTGPLAALVFTLLRVTGWPIVGLVTDVPALSAIVTAVVIALAVIGLRMSRGDAAIGMRWLVGLLGWSVLALAFAAPSLQRVVVGLPNDHYHAFADPIVALVIAIPAADLFARAAAAKRETARPLALVALGGVWAGLAVLLVVTVIRRPPQVDPDGGWTAARVAGEHIVGVAGDRPIGLLGIPEFKLADGIGFPIEHAGGDVGPIDGSRTDQVLVVACDRLFETVVGAPCGGPAEDAAIDDRFAGIRPTPALIERFPASPRTWISIYRLGLQVVP